MKNVINKLKIVGLACAMCFGVMGAESNEHSGSDTAHYGSISDPLASIRMKHDEQTDPLPVPACLEGILTKFAVFISDLWEKFPSCGPIFDELDDEY